MAKLGISEPERRARHVLDLRMQRLGIGGNWSHDSIDRWEISKRKREEDEAAEGSAAEARAEEERRIWTAGELAAAEFTRPEGYLDGRIFVPGSVGVIAGREGVGKTYLVLELIRALSMGSTFGPLAAKQGRTLFVSEEMRADEIRDRMLQLYSVSELEEISRKAHFMFETGLRLDRFSDLEILGGKILKSRADFLIADALSDLKGDAAENSNDEMGSVLRGLRDVARAFEVPVLAVHHTGKPTQFLSGSDLLRGASAIKQICADVAIVTRKGGDRVFTFTKTRHGAEPPPFAFTIEGDGGTGPVRIVFKSAAGAPAAEPAGPGEDSERAIHKLLRRLKAKGDGSYPPSATTIEDEIGGDRNAVRAARRSLVEKGEILETRRPGRGGGYVYGYPADLDPNSAGAD